MIDGKDFEILTNIKQSHEAESRIGYAIYEMTQMGTINSITKDNLFDIVKWLLPIAFETPIEPTDVYVEPFETEGLDPCPFCNGKAHLYKDKQFEYLRYVECQSCYARTDGVEGKLRAMEKWNERPNLGCKEE